MVNAAVLKTVTRSFGLWVRILHFPLKRNIMADHSLVAVLVLGRFARTIPRIVTQEVKRAVC